MFFLFHAMAVWAHMLPNNPSTLFLGGDKREERELTNFFPHACLVEFEREKGGRWGNGEKQ